MGYSIITPGQPSRPVCAKMYERALASGEIDSILTFTQSINQPKVCIVRMQNNET